MEGGRGRGFNSLETHGTGEGSGRGVTKGKEKRQEGSPESLSMYVCPRLGGRAAAPSAKAPSANAFWGKGFPAR